MTTRDWTSWPVHHVLIAAYPILYLVSSNVGEVNPQEALVPLAVSVGVALALFAVLRFAGVSARRSAFVVSVLAVVTLLFGRVAGAVEPLGFSGLPLLAGWLLLALAVIVIMAFSRTDLRGVTAVMNIGSAVLVGFTVVGIGGYIVNEPGAFLGGQPVDVDGSGAPTESPDGTPGTPPRDIYYFVLDGYGAPRAVDQYLDVQPRLMDSLEASGFSVLHETHSNYRSTVLSLSSTLNMMYLDEVAARYGTENPHQHPLYELIRNAESIQFLKERGYSYVLLGSDFNITATSPLADVNPVFEQTSDFMGVLIESTILPSVVSLAGVEDDLTDRRRRYDATMWQLETFPELARLPGPKFVFTHFLVPHPPRVMDEDGGYVSADAEADRPPVERFRAQWAFVDREIEELIEGLLAGPDETDPIIIISPDHGPTTPGMPQTGPNIDWGSANDAQLDLVFSIASAYHLPGLDESCLYPGMSSVNAFRLVFNLYFDAGLPLLPDRSFLHTRVGRPYDLTEVTDRLPDSGAGSETETTCDP